MCIRDRYNRNPYDIQARKITFAQVYERWMEQYSTVPVKGKLPAEGTIKIYRAAYNHCKPLHDMIFSEITLLQLQDVVDVCSAGAGVQQKIKVLYHHLYKYAIKYEIADNNLASLIVITKKEDIKRNPFTVDEVRNIWKMPESVTRDLTLILLYTGMRADEVLQLNEIHSTYMVGGSKTEAGKNRIIPIHSDIAPIVRRQLPASVKYYRFWQDFTRLFPGHTPHDCRRTFISRAEELGINGAACRKIVGHVGKDVHENAYTFLSIDFLYTEIQRLCY